MPSKNSQFTAPAPKGANFAFTSKKRTNAAPQDDDFLDEMLREQEAVNAHPCAQSQGVAAPGNSAGSTSSENSEPESKKSKFSLVDFLKQSKEQTPAENMWEPPVPGREYKCIMITRCDRAPGKSWQKKLGAEKSHTLIEVAEVLEAAANASPGTI